jgi:beta-1,4-mannosyl-glycoprotein beta-1,4-N-acetylglucosaminyltransferase
MLIDSFIFFNEFDILKERLRYLNDTVDWFVLIEADTTFSGKSKPFYFQQNRDKFKEFLHKIVFVPLKFNPEMLRSLDFTHKPTRIDFNAPSWKLEINQRNGTNIALKQFKLDAFVMLGDVDEFPTKIAIKEAIKKLENNMVRDNIVSLKQDLFFYNGKQCLPNHDTNTIIARNSVFATRTPSIIRKYKSKFVTIENAGWHLSYFGTPEAIANKLRSFSHQEYNTKQFTDLEYINKRIEAGEDLFQREKLIFEKVDPLTLNPDLKVILTNLGKM